MSNLIELPPNHYCVHVTYAPMPSRDALLKGKLTDRDVSPIFDGRPFSLHTSCVGMDRTPGERVFYNHNVGRDWEGEEQIAWGLKQRNMIARYGYRPAIHVETYEFLKAHRELWDFIGLGSFMAVNDVHRFVTYVWEYGGCRVLGSSWLGRKENCRKRVLFVAITEDDLRGMRK